MNYDFITILDRCGKDSKAVDMPTQDHSYGGHPIDPNYSIIPMWVADMSFPTAPSIIEKLTARANVATFGYFSPREEYLDAIVNWQKSQFHLTDITKENIGYENGVLGGITNALRVLCQPGDSILVQSPTYIGFTKVAKDNGYNFVFNSLIQDENGNWQLDYEDMENKIRDHHLHTAIFCSPHNPTGRVWTKEELEKAMAIFKKYDVTIISDEIWSDLTMPGVQHIPTQSISEDARQRTVAFYAPSKTFSLAGLIGSYHVIYNPVLHEKITNCSKATHYNSLNVLSMYALMGGYSAEGKEWLEQLKAVLQQNMEYAVDFIRTNFKGVQVSKPEGTYMLFLDCAEWCKEHHQTIEQVHAAGVKVGVIWQDGRAFHGETHIRMNLALPHSLVVEAFNRLKEHVFNEA